MRGAVAVAILGVILVACGSPSAPSIQISESPSTTPQSIATPTASPSPVAQAIATPIPTPRPKPATPPIPTGVRITRQGCYTGPVPDGVPSGTCTTTLTWTKVPAEGTRIEVYGVTKCLSRTERAGDGSCLVEGTAVPPDTRKLIAQAPASKGTVSWTGPAWLDVIDADTGAPRSQAIGVERHGYDIYFATIVASSNEAGRSKFVIADAGSWCYDTGCEGP